MIPEVHVDYCFMGSKGDATTRCIVVAKEYESKSVIASVVPVKGSSNEISSEGNHCVYTGAGFGKPRPCAPERSGACPSGLAGRGGQEACSSEKIL